MTFGLTLNGFVAKRLDDCKAELEAAYRVAFGDGIKTTPDTMFGKLIGLHADREASLWELVEAVYGSSYPSSASGQSLANIGQLTDIAPNAATMSEATVYLAGLASAIVPAGSLVATQEAGDQFRIQSNIQLPGGAFSIQGITRVGSVATAAAMAHGRLVGDWVFISGANEAEYNGLHQVATVPDVDSFTYAVTGTPATPATGAPSGDPAVAALAKSVVSGPVQALAGTLTVIVTPVPGWIRAENAVDATLGQDAETDAAFRLRRIASLKGLGAARQEAIRGALLGLSGVSQVVVFVNDTDGTVDGRPPHSIECLVFGGVDQDILDTIWDKKAAGIQAHGNITGSVTDSQGTSHTVKFSRAVVVEIHLELDLTVDASYPATGDALVEAAVLAFGQSLAIGQDVIVYPSLIASFASVPGITDVAVRIGIAASPTLDDNIIIAPTDIAVFDSSRITIVQI